MTLEQQVSSALTKRDDSRELDLWHTQANIISSGIDRSGLGALLGQSAEQNKAGFAELTGAVMRSAVLTDHGLTDIARALAAQTSSLNSIVDLLRYPLGTQARELYERGVRALNAGWTDEAIKELTASVTADPYNPAAQFALALAQATTGDNASAAKSMALVVRYSADQRASAPLAAGAAILGANAYLAVGDAAAAKALVAQARARVSDCAELELMAGRLENDEAATARAIALAPELALDAIALGLPGAREAARTVVNSGPVDAMYRAHEVWRALGQSPMELPDRENTPHAVMAHAKWLRNGKQQMAGLDGAQSRVLETLQSQLYFARIAADQAPTEANVPPDWHLILAWSVTALVAVLLFLSGGAWALVVIFGGIAVVWAWVVVLGNNGRYKRREFVANRGREYEKGQVARSEVASLTRKITALKGGTGQESAALRAALDRADPVRTHPLWSV